MKNEHDKKQMAEKKSGFCFFPVELSDVKQGLSFDGNEWRGRIPWPLRKIDFSCLEFQQNPLNCLCTFTRSNLGQRSLCGAIRRASQSFAQMSWYLVCLEMGSRKTCRSTSLLSLFWFARHCLANGNQEKQGWWCIDWLQNLTEQTWFFKWFSSCESARRSSRHHPPLRHVSSPSPSYEQWQRWLRDGRGFAVAIARLSVP